MTDETGVQTHMATFAIGVDLGGTNLRIAAVDNNGRVLEKITTGTPVAKGRGYVIDEMSSTDRTLAAKLRSTGIFAGIGIGVPVLIAMQIVMLIESPNPPCRINFPV